MFAPPWTRCFTRETKWSDGGGDCFKRNILWFFQPMTADRGEQWNLFVQCFCEYNHSAHQLCVTATTPHDITLSSLLIPVQSCKKSLLIVILPIILFFSDAYGQLFQVNYTYLTVKQLEIPLFWLPFLDSYFFPAQIPIITSISSHMQDLGHLF